MPANWPHSFRAGQGRDALHPRPTFKAPSGGGINVKGYGPDGADKVGERTYSSRTVVGGILSPPYGELALTDGAGMSAAVGNLVAQIGNLRDPKGDAERVVGAVTSPPWEKQSRGGQQGWSNPEMAAVVAAAGYKDGRRRGHKASAKAIAAQMRRDDQKVYGQTKGQIGNTEKETYCAAMLCVYQQMFAVLKPGGVVCLVTKNPVKNGAIRRLDLHTIRLMEAAGFEFLERQMAMLAQDLPAQRTLTGEVVERRAEHKSFFKRLYERKNPHLRVDHEDILWFRKPPSR